MTYRLELLHDLHNAGIAIHLDGDDLVLIPASRVTDHLAEKLRNSKSNLIRILADPSNVCEHCGGQVVRDQTCDGYLNRLCMGCGRWFTCTRTDEVST